MIRVISARRIHRKEKNVYEQIQKFPKFKSETEERSFWEKNDFSDFVHWKEAESVLMPNLKPSTKTISLRLPESPEEAE